MTPWRRSSRCQTSECAEVAAVPGAVLVRDTRHREEPVLAFTAAAWRQFTARLNQAEVREVAGDGPSG